MLGHDKTQMVRREDALPGRAQAMAVAEHHFVLGTPLRGPFAGMELACFGMGCFWGAERCFWSTAGVHSTAVGFAGGFTPHATYEEVCSGLTGHDEVVQIAFDPRRVTYEALLRLFWESHDPTQGMRQGNDRGTQYRSGIYCHGDAQLAAATSSKQRYEQALRDAGRAQPITTEIVPAPPFYYAEDYHQQYLAKNPGGYCGLGGTGVSCPTPASSRG